MTYHQARVWADTIEDAVAIIRQTHPEGKLTIRETHVPKWWEYTVVV